MEPFENNIELQSRSNTSFYPRNSNASLGTSNSGNKEDAGMKLMHSITNVFKGITWENEGLMIVTSPYLFSQQSKKKIIKDLLISSTGTNNDQRKIFWLHASNAYREKNNNPTLYYNLLNNYPKHIPSPFTSQIEVDLLRTYPEFEYFKSQANIDKLRNVLLAFSRRNVSIGYVQGFNFMVGRLLMLFDSEEDAFWVFTQVMEEFLPLEFYIELAGILIDCAVAVHILKENLPEVVGHLTKLGGEMCLNNVLFQWFDSLFVQNMNAEISANIWDMLFLEGNLIIFKATIAIFTLLKSDIMAIESMEDLFNLFEVKVLDLKPKKFMKEIIKVKFNDDPELMRKFYMSQTVDVLKNSFDIKINMNNKKKSVAGEDEKGKECNIAWPVCIDKCTVFEIPKVSMVRQYNRICYEEDFFKGDVEQKKKDYERNNIKNINEKTDAIYKGMLIERHPHTCAKEKYIKNTSMKNLLSLMIPFHEDDHKPETSIAKILQKVDSIKSYHSINSANNQNKNTNEIIEDSD